MSSEAATRGKSVHEYILSIKASAIMADAYKFHETVTGYIFIYAKHNTFYGINYAHFFVHSAIQIPFVSLKYYENVLETSGCSKKVSRF